jgi:threonine dehydratase
MANSHEINLQDVILAKSTIADSAKRTPLIASNFGSGNDVFLKLENLQTTGSFKIRGAANKLKSLTLEQRQQGVLAVSSGNHGRAVSKIARQLEINATICITDKVPALKVDAMRALGAEVIVAGDNWDEAEAHAHHLVAKKGMIFVNPFDDPHVIAGQGTIGLEILEDLPDVDTVIVPTSGGGLIAGIALAMKSENPKLRVVGVTMEQGAAMYLSLEAGHLVPVDEFETLADALIGGLGIENHYSIAMCQRYVDEIVLVSEEKIAEAMAYLLREEHLVVEGGGAVGMAALLQHKVDFGKHVVVVISGGNVELELLLSIAKKYV